MTNDALGALVIILMIMVVILGIYIARTNRFIADVYRCYCTIRRLLTNYVIEEKLQHGLLYWIQENPESTDNVFHNAMIDILKGSMKSDPDEESD